MKFIKTAIIAAIMMSSASAHAEVEREPLEFEFHYGTECEERCYEQWPACLEDVSGVMGLCLNAYPGQFCELLLVRDIQTRCTGQVERCTRSCVRR